MTCKHNRPVFVAALSAVALLCTECGSSSHRASSGPTPASSNSAQPFTVASTLDGHATLPRRLQWQATPSIPPSQVQEVDFLIDGRVAWIEHDAPYIFGGDDNGSNRGYLITTWLSPGPHVFIAKAIDINGQQATNTANAEVARPPEPPPELRGIWTRVITAQEIAKLAGPLTAGGTPPAGRWELAFDNVGAWYLDPQGSGIAHDLIVQDHTLTIDAPIQMAPFNNGQTTTTAYGHKNIGGTDCTPAGCPCETYQWSRSGDTLTLAVLHCRYVAAQFVDGAWTRAPKQIPASLKP
jgi:hypothetical protein